MKAERPTNNWSTKKRLRTAGFYLTLDSFALAARAMGWRCSRFDLNRDPLKRVAYTALDNHGLAEDVFDFIEDRRIALRRLVIGLQRRTKLFD